MIRLSEISSKKLTINNLPTTGSSKIEYKVNLTIRLLIKEIITKYIKNKNKETENSHLTKKYKFYINNFLFHRGSQEIFMDAAWIQTKGPYIGENFLTGVQNWPSFTRAEIIAITIVFLTVPSNNKVVIYTDS